MSSTGDLKLGLQGLIQIAAGLHKRSRGQTTGAEYLISRGLAKIKLAQKALPADVVSAFLAKTKQSGQP